VTSRLTVQDQILVLGKKKIVPITNQNPQQSVESHKSLSVGYSDQEEMIGLEAVLEEGTFSVIDEAVNNLITFNTQNSMRTIENWLQTNCNLPKAYLRNYLKTNPHVSYLYSTQVISEEAKVRSLLT
jgi:hypothetical protein